MRLDAIGTVLGRQPTECLPVAYPYDESEIPQ